VGERSLLCIGPVKLDAAGDEGIDGLLGFRIMDLVSSKKDVLLLATTIEVPW
jgi:hypothetical protein